MSGGDLPGYIEKNPNVDRLKLVGCSSYRDRLLLTPSSAIRRREWPLLPPLVQCGPRGPQGSMRSF